MVNRSWWFAEVWKLKRVVACAASGKFPEGAQAEVEPVVVVLDMQGSELDGKSENVRRKNGLVHFADDE